MTGLIDWKRVALVDLVRRRGQLPNIAWHPYAAEVAERLHNFGECLYTAGGLAVMEHRAELRAKALLRALGAEFEFAMNLVDEPEVYAVWNALVRAIEKVTPG